VHLRASIKKLIAYSEVPLIHLHLNDYGAL